jgi:hypothetical protein
MPGHDPFRAQSATALADPPQALTGDGGHQIRVPKGNVAKVTEWIGKGKSGQARRERAEAALAAEQESGKPRKGVVAAAESVLAG